MKKALFVFVLFLGFVTQVYSQKTATYNQVINKEVKGSLESYTTQAGEVFKVGDEIELGVPKGRDFAFIKQEFALNFYPLSSTASHSKVKIKAINASSRLVTIRTTPAQGYVYGLWIMNFESAIKDGEVKTNLMSSNEALDELKRWKDKFDLGLISEEEYLKKKTELSKLIK